MTFNFFSGSEETNDYEFEVLDTEETISKFKELCQHELTFSNNENKCWFYLVSYYLFKNGYEIKEFPKVLARTPINPNDFTYKERRNKIITAEDDDKGTVRYVTRRAFVSGLHLK